MRPPSFTVALLATLCVASAAATSAASDEWRFAVSLDGKPIGYHHFLLRAAGARRELVSEARFNVKILFVNAYRYAHDDRELWADDCLQQIESRTNDNGTMRTVRGEHVDARFKVAAGHATNELDDCVMTFAYWNPHILTASRLLNPQTGEYVPIHVTRFGSETIVAHGVAQQAERYRLEGAAAIGGKLQIDLWYSSDQSWLALESLTEDGRRLRYQIQ